MENHMFYWEIHYKWPIFHVDIKLPEAIGGLRGIPRDGGMTTTYGLCVIGFYHHGRLASIFSMMDLYGIFTDDT